VHDNRVRSEPFHKAELSEKFEGVFERSATGLRGQPLNHPEHALFEPFDLEAMAAATRQRNASHIAVHEAMSPHVRSCFAEDEVGAALKQMEEARVRRLPVLDATWHLTGILSIDDIMLRALDQTNGVSSAEFVKALQRICSQPAVEPGVNLSDTFVTG
jgi:hypothetical protein